jgi:hypothetical protein
VQQQQPKKPYRGPFASAGNSPLAERELRRVFGLAGVVMAAAVLILCWPFGPVRWPHPGAVTKGNYDRVYTGMPEHRVEELFGPDGRPDPHGPASGDGREAKRVYWTSDTGTTVAVSFDRDGRVLAKKTVGPADWGGAVRE